MAIDTASKRASTISAYDFDFGMHVPSSGGIDDAFERAAVSYAYAGIASSGAVGAGAFLPHSRARRLAALMAYEM